MKNLFEQFKSGKLKEIYVKYDTRDSDFLVYLKYKGLKGDDGLLFDTVSIGFTRNENSPFSLSEQKGFRIREATVNSFDEISAEKFYEAYNVYVKYKSCFNALKSIFNAAAS